MWDETASKENAVGNGTVSKVTVYIGKSDTSNHQQQHNFALLHLLQRCLFTHTYVSVVVEMSEIAQESKSV